MACKVDTIPKALISFFSALVVMSNFKTISVQKKRQTYCNAMQNLGQKNHMKDDFYETIIWEAVFCKQIWTNSVWPRMFRRACNTTISKSHRLLPECLISFVEYKCLLSRELLGKRLFLSSLNYRAIKKFSYT